MNALLSNLTASMNVHRTVMLTAAAALLVLSGCSANERSTIPGGIVDEGEDGEPGGEGEGNPGGEIDTSEPEALEVVDFGETSGMTLAQVGHAKDMTNNPDMSRYVDISAVLQLNGAGDVADDDLSLAKLDDSGAESAVEVDVVRSYDGGTAWIMPKSLLAPGSRYKLHVTKGAATETQAFRTQIDVGEIEAGGDSMMMNGVAAGLHLRPTGAVHPSEAGVGEAFLSSLGLLLAAGGASVNVEGTDSLQGSVELAGFLSDDVDMDGSPDREDLAAGTLMLTGEAHGHYVRLHAKVADEVALTVTGRLRAFDSGWRLMGGAAVVNTTCDMFPSEAGQAACDGDDLVVISSLKGETIYLSDLKVADKALMTGEGDARNAVVELSKPRWVADKDATADAIDLSGTVRAQVLTGGEVALDSMDGAELIATPECGDDGCFVHRVGLVVGGDALPAGVVTLRVTLGLQSAEVQVVEPEPEVDEAPGGDAGGDDAE